MRSRRFPSRNAELCRHFWTRLGSSRLKSVNRHRDRGFVVAKRRSVVTFGLVSGLRVSKVSTDTGIGGSWSRNAELSSLLDSSRVFASQKCQQTQGSGVRGRETQICRHFWTRLGSSRLKSVNRHRDRGVVVAKRRSVVTFGLVSGLRVSKVSTDTGIGGSWSRNADLSSLLDSSRVFASQKCQQTQGSGVRGRETQICRHFWTRLGSSRLKSVNRHRDRGFVVAKRRSVVTFGLVSGLRVSKVSTDTGIGGSWSRNADLSSLLDSSRVFASQKCQQAQGSGGSWSRNADLSSLLDSSRVFASQKCQQTQGSGGRGRETQICRHFWTRLGSSRLKSVNRHRDRGVVVAKRRTVVTFGLVSGLRVSKVSTDTGIGDLSSLLDLSRVFASQNCQQTQGSGVVVAKRRSVVTFGLVWDLRVSKVSTGTGIRGVVVAKRRSVVTFGLVSGLRVSKASTGTGIGGVVVAKRRSVVTFGLAFGERKGQQRRETRGERGKEREERREKRREKREEREEKREERGERRGEWIEERREERGQRRGEKREERGERGEDRGWRMEEREERRERLGDRGEERRERREEIGERREERGERRGERREDRREEREERRGGERGEKTGERRGEIRERRAEESAEKGEERG